MSVKENVAAEKELETHRKKTSPNKGAAQNPGDVEGGREKYARESVGEGQLNLGSNRNMGRKSEQEDAPDSAVPGSSESESGAVPLQAAFESKGEAAKRSVKASKATLGRHVVAAKDGKAVSQERAEHVRSRRAEQDAVWDSHRKKSSSV